MLHDGLLLQLVEDCEFSFGTHDRDPIGINSGGGVTSDIDSVHLMY
jgi:hypothetical protein